GDGRPRRGPRERGGASSPPEDPYGGPLPGRRPPSVSCAAAPCVEALPSPGVTGKQDKCHWEPGKNPKREMRGTTAIWGQYTPRLPERRSTMLQSQNGTGVRVFRMSNTGGA